MPCRQGIETFPPPQAGGPCCVRHLFVSRQDYNSVFPRDRAEKAAENLRSAFRSLNIRANGGSHVSAFPGFSALKADVFEGVGRDSPSVIRRIIKDRVSTRCPRLGEGARLMCVRGC